MTEQERVRLQTYLERAGRYFELKFTEATYCGALLQIAAVGIRVFSGNNAIPPSCRHLVKPSDKSVIPFCIGQQRHGLPIGLIIYAGRNQYNHWEEQPQSITRQVFAALTAAHVTSPLADLAFDLGNPTIIVYANEILLGALAWTTYHAYEAGVRELLEPWAE
jgi:hypothetical protein